MTNKQINIKIFAENLNNFGMVEKCAIYDREMRYA